MMTLWPVLNKVKVHDHKTGIKKNPERSLTWMTFFKYWHTRCLYGFCLYFRLTKNYLVQPIPPDEGLDSILVKASLRDISAREYQFD